MHDIWREVSVDRSSLWQIRKETSILGGLGLAQSAEFLDIPACFARYSEAKFLRRFHLSGCYTFMWNIIFHHISLMVIRPTTILSAWKDENNGFIFSSIESYLVLYQTIMTDVSLLLWRKRKFWRKKNYCPWIKYDVHVVVSMSTRKKNQSFWGKDQLLYP